MEDACLTTTGRRGITSSASRRWQCRRREDHTPFRKKCIHQLCVGQSAGLVAGPLRPHTIRARESSSGERVGRITRIRLHAIAFCSKFASAFRGALHRLSVLRGGGDSPSPRRTFSWPRPAQATVVWRYATPPTTVRGAPTRHDHLPRTPALNRVALVLFGALAARPERFSRSLHCAYTSS